MDLKDYKIKNTTMCECGYEFSIHDMNKLQRISDTSFYGGIVKHVDEIICPDCKRETLLLIKQQGQTYIIKDIAQKDLVVEKGQNSEITTEQNKEIVTENSTIGNKEETETSNKIICPVCKRSFKNKSGLSIHMKTHENK